MPWNVAHNPTVDYDTRIVKIGDVVLNPCSNDVQNDSGPVKISNLGVRKFRKMMKGPSGDFEVFQLVSKNNLQRQNQGRNRKGRRMQDLLKSMKHCSKMIYPLVCHQREILIMRL